MSEQHLHVSVEGYDNDICTLTGTYSGTYAPASVKVGPGNPTRYEYKTVRVSGVAADFVMNDWYSEGWEPMFAVATGEFNERLIFTLRRPVYN